MIKRTSLDQVALADQFPLASGVAVPSGASQPDAVAVFGSQSPMALAGDQLARYARREPSAKPSPNAMNIPPVKRSQALTVAGRLRKPEIGRVARIRHANQMSPSSACMAPNSRIYGATETPSGTNCGRKET